MCVLYKWTCICVPVLRPLLQKLICTQVKWIPILPIFVLSDHLTVPLRVSSRVTLDESAGGNARVRKIKIEKGNKEKVRGVLTSQALRELMLAQKCISRTQKHIKQKDQYIRKPIFFLFHFCFLFPIINKLVLYFFQIAFIYNGYGIYFWIDKNVLRSHVTLTRAASSFYSQLSSPPTIATSLENFLLQFNSGSKLSARRNKLLTGFSFIIIPFFLLLTFI